MVQAKICGTDSVLSYLGALGTAISRSKYHMSDICEIRLRAGQPIVLETLRGRFPLDRKATFEEIADCIKSFCHYSLHSYERELREGYITLKGGHRAGFCGSAVLHDDRIDTVKNISSINIRIAREITGSADLLEQTVFSEDFRGLLIAGRPMSGKTTVLRDLCRIIGNKHKLAVIDTRSEIAASYNGVPQNDIGAYTDILNGYPRNEGIEIATRTLSPEYIACDEITGETNFTRLCLNSGVKLIFTAHCGTVKQARSTPIVKSGVISHIAFLGGKPGQITERQAIE